MIYVIKDKPYVRVAHYYKEVKITKNGENYNVYPVGGIETRIENPDINKIEKMSIIDYYKINNSNKKNNKQNNSSFKFSSLK